MGARLFLFAAVLLLQTTGLMPSAAVARPAAEVDTVVFVGSDPDAHMGYAVADAGDVNGDGFADVILSEHNINRAVVHFGGPAMDAIPDVVLTSSSAMFGVAVCGAGDMNHDGFDDILVAAMADDGDRGTVYLYLGSAAMDAVADRVFHGDAGGDYFGYAVCSAGDANGDGFDDVVVTAPTSDARGVDAGRAYLFFGGAVPDAVPDVLFYGEATGDKFGIHAGYAGDQNGDGYGDVVISAPDRDSYRGAVYVFHGGPAMDGVPDRILNGITDEGRLGACLPLLAGDVNGDGHYDLVAGGGEIWTFRGSLYVFLGGPGADDIPDIVVDGEADGDGFACGPHSLATGEDINGDGYDDILVGAPSNGTGGVWAGKAYLYLGGATPDGGVDRVWWGTAGDRVGNSVALVSDADGNGSDDVLVGAADDYHLTPPWHGYASLYLMARGTAVRNPGFESGLAPWRFFTNGSGTFTASTPGHGSPTAGCVRVTAPGTNVQLYQAGLYVEPGARFRLSFAAYSTTGHDMAISLHRHTPPATNYGLANYVVDLSTGWQEFAIEFTASGFPDPVEDARLRFWLAPYAAAGDRYYLDDVLLERIGTAMPPVNVVRNPNFEDGRAPWRFYTSGVAGFEAQAPGFVGARAAWVSITAPGTNTQLYQSGLRLLPNTRYRLSFAAIASAGSDIVVTVQRHDAPYTNYGFHRLVDLAATWGRFSFEFRTTGFPVPVSDGRLRFSMDAAAGGEAIAIDNVELSAVVARGDPRQLAEGAPDASREPRLEQNHPNPFNPSTRIRFELPDAARISLAVYDLLGRKVEDLAGGEYGAGQYAATWNAGGAASGVYLARFIAVMSAGGVTHTKTQKLLLMK